MNFRDLYDELKRRNVIKVATVYGITAWVIAQIVALATDAFGAPGWVLQMVIVLLLVGFPMALIFAWAFEMTPDGIRKTGEVEQVVSKTDATGKKLNWMIIGALVLLLIVVGTERIFFAGGYSDSPKDSAARASIAVLPFDNISSNAEGDAYFSNGLSEELLNTLSQVETMKVAGRTSSFRFKDEKHDTRQIASQLGVKHILDGSVRKADNRVRITVQLIDAENGTNMWSQTYDRTLDDIFAIQEEISTTVLNELKVQLLPKTEKQLTSRPTDNIEAYQIYMKANQMIASRGLDDITNAIGLYEEAIRMDPKFAEAHAKLAIAYSLQGYYGNKPMDKVLNKVRSQADRALLLDSNLGEAYAAIGLYYEDSGKLEKARDAYRKSLELNPGQPSVHSWLGNVYRRLEGEGSPQTIYHFTQMYEMEPLAPLSLYSYTYIKIIQGQTKEAERISRKNSRLNPGFLSSQLRLSEIKFHPPTGRLDSALVYAHKTHVEDTTFAGAMFTTSDLAVRLGIPPLAKTFHSKLQRMYPNNQNYIASLLTINSILNDNEKTESVVYNYIERQGLPLTYTSDYIYYPLDRAAETTGNYSSLIELLQNQVPALFAPSPKPVTLDNYHAADLLIGIWQAQGKDREAKQLTDAFCKGIEHLKGSFPGRQSMGFYELNKAACLLHRKEYAKALPYLKVFFLEKNGIYYTPRIFDRSIFAGALRRPAYRELYGQIQNRLERQRGNALQYLREVNAWRPEWNDKLPAEG